MNTIPNRYILAITGASGMPYALKLIQELKKKPGLELHLIISNAAKDILPMESRGWEKIVTLADHAYDQNQLTAPMASGSWLHQGMVVCPCSMATLAAIANGLGNNLIHRAADVCLKENRPLVLVPRETPLNAIHLQNMSKAQQAGAVILPPSPGFYHQPQTIDDLISQIVSRIMDHLGIENNIFKRWGTEMFEFKV